MSIAGEQGPKPERTPAAARAFQLAFVLLACAPLAWRVAGFGAVIAERLRRGSWPDYSDAVFRSNSVLAWMLHTRLPFYLCIAAAAAPLLLMVWLGIERCYLRTAAEIAREFRRLAVMWAVGIGSAVLLAWLRVTGVY